MSREILLTLRDKDPYASNPHAKEISRTLVYREGREYTKIDYSRTFSALNRTIKIICAFVVTIFTMLLGLAFQNVRNLWVEGFTGKEDVSVLIPSREHMQKEATYLKKEMFQGVQPIS